MAFGAETSSRNSEVIHAGLYYPIGSAKTRLCIRGRELMYQVCSKYSIPHHKVGKWIFATDYADPRWTSDLAQTANIKVAEEKYLHTLQDKCKTLGIPSRWVLKPEIMEKEPHLRASMALESPETGIVDSHSLMDFLHSVILSNGGTVALGTVLTDSTRNSTGYRLKFNNSDDTCVECRSVVNSAGLLADRVSKILMEGQSPYHLFHAKGHYYAYSGRPLVSRLAYPIPDQHLASLGVHTVLDLSGRMKFGPDIEYLPTSEEYPDYSFVDSPTRKQVFYQTVKTYLPDLEIEKLSPDFCGIRPKIAPEGGAFQDFVIRHEEPSFPGLVNLIGIESPGLTSSMAIADEVAKLLGYPALPWVEGSM